MRLLIQFTDANLSDFRWATCDEVEGSAALDWQYAPEAELATLAAQHPHPVIVLIPQECIYLTRVELPEKASRQLIGAIEYQVEDRLAQDIESQHFALGDIRDNPIAIAVVSREIMDRCVALSKSHGLRLAQIIPEIYLCPWSGEGVAIAEGHDGWLLRYGDYRGLKCHASALPAMLELVRREVEFERIRCYLDASTELPSIDGTALERYQLNEVRPGFVDSPVIDLQQRNYQVSSPWLGLARSWKWVGMLAAALLVAFAFNRAVALQNLRHEIDEIRQQQYELVKPYLPADTVPGDNLKGLLIQRMQQLQASQREQGFLQLMLEFVRARKDYPDVEISRIGYQSGRLSFDISSKRLTDIESLLASVKKQGVAAKLESLNIKPDLSSGRLVLEGGGDA
jgi:type II secretion system protein L